MPSSPTTSLKRSLSLPLVALYGLGNILGAGVYVLIGRVAGDAGMFAPVAFLFASMIAAVTAFSYAELSSRYPVSAGEAVYIHEGFGVKQLSLLVGLLIILTGIVSSATIAKGFVGYLQVFIEIPDWLVIISLLSALALIAGWGISQSVSVAGLLALLEVGGLLLIIGVAAPALGEFPARSAEFVPSFELDAWIGIVSGAFLAFYAYVGFEDMVNVAEEVNNPQKNLPYAILMALTLASALYILVAVACLLVLTPEQLDASDAPLAAVYETVTGNSPWLISIISMFAVVNGALIQIIMASRVCYGLAQQRWLPKLLGAVNARTRTPINATLLVTLIIIISALWLPIETLARATTYLLLVVFSLVNLSLIKIKLNSPPADGYFIVPMTVPILGLLICLLFLLLQTATLIGS